MNFIGNYNNQFNIELMPLIYNVRFTVVSCIDGNFTYDSKDDFVVQLLPVMDDINYYKAVDKAYSKMITNGLYDTFQRCTSIIISQPDYVKSTVVADIINNLDTDALVDTIWVYPDPVKIVCRNNEIEKLPYQMKFTP